MKVMASIYVERPPCGYVMVCERLKALLFSITRHHCGTLICKVGLHCMVRKPRTTMAPLRAQCLPVANSEPGCYDFKSGLGAGHYVDPDRKRFCDSGVRHVYLLQKESVLRDCKHPGCKLHL